jgi:hypothetical protein
MKKTSTILAIILFALTGCGEQKPLAGDVITVDVTANYPAKELILQDFMDVEYIPLETTDDFLTQGFVRAIGKDLILVTNRNDDGDIFIFDRNGKGIRKINRKGQGGEEYSQSTEIVPDEDHSEMFVEDYHARKILVYDLYGNFKRSFKFADSCYYRFLFNYDRDHLICNKTYFPVDNEQSCYMIISKQDGSITREIHIPYKEIETPVIIGEMEGEELRVTPNLQLTAPCHGNWVLTNTSSDTAYIYSPDGNLIPFIARTPSIHAMDPEIFLFPSILTDRYYFMKTMKKVFDIATMQGFPSTDLVYDRQEKTIFKYTVCNDDFSDRRQVGWSKPVNDEIATWQCLEAHELVESYGKGELKGPLKDVAAGLDEESNPVIMLIKHRKN